MQPLFRRVYLHKNPLRHGACSEGDEGFFARLARLFSDTATTAKKYRYERGVTQDPIVFAPLPTTSTTRERGAIVSEEAFEKFGEIIDEIDNLAHALTLPLPLDIHHQQMTLALPQIVKSLKEVFVEITGENPWDDEDGLDNTAQPDEVKG
jgi:hypothetical protein